MQTYMYVSYSCAYAWIFMCIYVICTNMRACECSYIYVPLCGMKLNLNCCSLRENEMQIMKEKNITYNCVPYMTWHGSHTTHHLTWHMYTPTATYMATCHSATHAPLLQTKSIQHNVDHTRVTSFGGGKYETKHDGAVEK